MQVVIRSELPKGIRFTNEMRRQLPFSQSQALNATVGNRAGINVFPEAATRGVIADMKRLMKTKLDRPKKQTVDGFYATTAKKTALFVRITPKNKPWDRNKYIQGNIKGGDRPPQWVEFKARKLSRLPRNIDLVPTHNLRRDEKTGGPKRTEVNKLFRNVSSGKTFIGKPENSTRPFGIYSVPKSGSLKAMFVARPRTNYPRLLAGMEQYAYSRASRTFGPYLERALARNVQASVGKTTTGPKLKFF